MLFDDDEIILDACDGKNDVIFLDPIAARHAFYFVKLI